MLLACPCDGAMLWEEWSVCSGRCVFVKKKKSLKASRKHIRSVVGGRQCESLWGQLVRSWKAALHSGLLSSSWSVSSLIFPYSATLYFSWSFLSPPLFCHILLSFFYERRAHQHHCPQPRNRPSRQLGSHSPPSRSALPSVVFYHGENVLLCALLQSSCGSVFSSSTI